MVQILPARRTFGSEFGRALGGGLGEGISSSLEKKHELTKLAKAAELKSKAKAAEQAEKLAQNRQTLAAIEKQRDLEPGSLSEFEFDPSMAERATKPQKKTQAAQPIDPEQLSLIQETRQSEEYKEASPARKYQLLTDAGVSKENAKSEADIYAEEEKIKQKSEASKEKSFERSYEAQKDFINKTTDAYKSFETDMKPRLMQMRELSDKDIIGPTQAKFMEVLNIPLGALENPQSELFDKLSHDLLKGLPDAFGSRILKVEVDNFLKTIPTLQNSSEGRRMILSNMIKLGEMKEVYYNAMRAAQKNALERRENLPEDFQQRVFDSVRPQINRINNEFSKMSEVTSVPQGTVPFFDPMGEIKFVPIEHMNWAIEKGGRRI